MPEECTYAKQLSEWEKARFGPAPEPALNPFTPTFTEMVAMSDGVRLYTEVFLPDGLSKPGPAVFIRSPYPYSLPSRHDKMSIPRYLESGYAIVFQLTRGQGQSEGAFHFFSDDADDGYEAISWIEEQSWCDGNIGMQGVSYLGGTQLLAARNKPKALKCIMPTGFLGNCTRSFPFSYGVPSKGFFMQWLQVVDATRGDDMEVAYGDQNIINHPKWGQALRERPLVDAATEVLSGDKLQAYRDIMSQPMDDDFWEKIHFTDDQLAALDIPMFFTDGWYDMTVGPIDFFSRLEKIYARKNIKGPDRYLLVGPWNHSQTYSPSKPGDFDGDRYLPDNAALDLVAQRLNFFDCYLKGDKNKIVQEDRVRVYISGPESSSVNRWYNFPTYPLVNTEQKCLYLHSHGQANNIPSDGVLDTEPPLDEPSDHYLYDPELPTASMIESSKDRRQTEIRADVLTYTTAPFSKPMTILGEIKLVLHAASDAPDTDWLAVITEVFPDKQSKSFHYAPLAFRARYREGLDREEFLTPDKPEEFRIQMGSAGHQIAAGNSIRLSIFSAAFPEYEPNSNTGKPVATDSDARPARQTIFHDTDRPSHIVLPIVTLTEPLNNYSVNDEKQ